MPDKPDGDYKVTLDEAVEIASSRIVHESLVKLRRRFWVIGVVALVLPIVFGWLSWDLDHRLKEANDALAGIERKLHTLISGALDPKLRELDEKKAELEKSELLREAAVEAMNRRVTVLTDNAIDQLVEARGIANSADGISKTAEGIATRAGRSATKAEASAATAIAAIGNAAETVESTFKARLKPLWAAVKDMQRSVHFVLRQRTDDNIVVAQTGSPGKLHPKLFKFKLGNVNEPDNPGEEWVVEGLEISDLSNKQLFPPQGKNVRALTLSAPTILS